MSAAQRVIRDDRLGHLLGLGSGMIEGFAGREQIADEALAHALRRDNTVRAITQRTFVQLRDQDPNLGAARIEHSE